jgi:hypothetical protein
MSISLEPHRAISSIVSNTLPLMNGTIRLSRFSIHFFNPINRSYLIRVNLNSIILHFTLFGIQSDIICNAVSCLFAISKRSNCKEFLLDGEEEGVRMMIALPTLLTAKSSKYIFQMSNLPSPQRFYRDTFLSSYFYFSFLFFCSTIARQCPFTEIVKKQ